MALQWPQSFATVFEKVLPPHVVQNVLNAADNLADSPNYWTAKVKRGSQFTQIHD